VLFSEPKIPQSSITPSVAAATPRFSALQRAENSSMQAAACAEARRWRFQCSSASRKFLNNGCTSTTLGCRAFQCSSASRKFLNRVDRAGRGAAGAEFQCSSASRKFLNSDEMKIAYVLDQGFSALQRAENSSMASGRARAGEDRTFQCSSASRKFLNSR